MRGGEDKVVKLFLPALQTLFGIQPLLNFGAEGCL